jgi:hypothetical protein
MVNYDKCVVCARSLEDGYTMTGVCDDCQYIIKRYFASEILQDFIHKNKRQLTNWVELHYLWETTCCRCKYHSISIDDESCERKENKCPHGMEGIPEIDKARPTI